MPLASTLIKESFTHAELDAVGPGYLNDPYKIMYRAWWEGDVFHFAYYRRPRATRPRTKLNRRASRRKA